MRVCVICVYILSFYVYRARFKRFLTVFLKLFNLNKINISKVTFFYIYFMPALYSPDPVVAFPVTKSGQSPAAQQPRMCTLALLSGCFTPNRDDLPPETKPGNLD